MALESGQQHPEELLFIWWNKLVVFSTFWACVLPPASFFFKCPSFYVITVRHNSVLLSEIRCILIVFRICQNPLYSVKQSSAAFTALSSFLVLNPIFVWFPLSSSFSPVSFEIWNSLCLSCCQPNIILTVPQMGLKLKLKTVQQLKYYSVLSGLVFFFRK